MTHPRGTVSPVGLPPAEFRIPIFDLVPERIIVRRSVVGTRKHLSDAIAFAAHGKVKTTLSERWLDDIHDIFAEMKKSQIEDRIGLSQL